MTKRKTDNLVTKSHLNNRLNRFKGELKKELKEDLLVIKDEIVGEIRDMREEFATHQFSHQRMQDTLDNHHERIDKLEGKTSK